MRAWLFRLLALLAAAGLLAGPAGAQTGEPSPRPTAPAPAGTAQADIPRVHTVLDGETLSGIAAQYGTTVEKLQLLNGISDPTLVYAGQELILPGGGGQAVAAAHVIRFGDNLEALAEAYNTSVAALAASNRLIRGDGLVAGRSLSVLSRTGTAAPRPLTGAAYLARASDTPLTIAAAHGVSPAALALANDLAAPGYVFAGQRLRIPGPGVFQDLPGQWRRVEVRPAQPAQGQSVAIYVESLLPGAPQGELAGRPLRFAPYGPGYLALAGFDAFSQPGRYELALSGGREQPWWPFAQPLELAAGVYTTQTITIPAELTHLLAPEVRAGEEALLGVIFEQFSDRPAWDAPFQPPVTATLVTAGYGDGRSYNQGPVEIFHTGVDYAGVVGTPIRAPAAGTVRFSDTLPLHGGTLIIDHGLGVMTGYYHLSEMHVDVGAEVRPGQIIAQAGSTGLANGPHLHWDLRILNVAVNPLQWTEMSFLPAP
ncbi:MAG: LysM peptidoglycan-binding domain-containing protein [Candidatus Promineifilaceae bacterium]